jgi:recombinational DNA repair ATPase RecF
MNERVARQVMRDCARRRLRLNRVRANETRRVLQGLESVESSMRRITYLKEELLRRRAWLDNARWMTSRAHAGGPKT